jgi:glycosyltransferase involved in cell wall biosynthesis
MSDTPTISILYPEVPQVRGGTEIMADNLCSRMKMRGIQTDVLTIPFQWEPKELMFQEILKWRMLQLEADLVIPIKFPAYCIQHPNKVIYLTHQFRQIYDFFGTPFSGFSNNVPDGALREKLVSIDNHCLSEAKAIYSIAENTRKRLKRYNGLENTVLYQPAVLTERLTAGDYGDYILAVSRLEESKRFDLTLRAIAASPENIRLRIAGSGPQEATLKALAGELGVEDRIEFLGFVDEESLIDLYAECCAVHYVPYDEDYGFITIEAMTAARPVVTAHDSGGPLEFVRDGANGFIAAPDPEAQAEKLTMLWKDRKLCGQLGEAARETVAHISWDAVVDELLGWLS